MGKRYGILIVVIAATAGFLGCTCGKNYLTANWGRSFELAKYNQYLNPEAEKNLGPVEGLNGLAAATVMEGYQNSFKGQKGAQSSGTQSSTPSMGSVAGVGQAQY